MLAVWFSSDNQPSLIGAQQVTTRTAYTFLHTISASTAISAICVKRSRPEFEIEQHKFRLQ